MTITLVDNWNPQSPIFSNNIEFLRASKSGGAQSPPAPPSEQPLIQRLSSFRGKILHCYGPVGTTELVLYGEIKCIMCLIWRVFKRGFTVYEHYITHAYMYTHAHTHTYYIYFGLMVGSWGSYWVIQPLPKQHDSIYVSNSTNIAIIYVVTVLTNHSCERYVARVHHRLLLWHDLSHI